MSVFAPLDDDPTYVERSAFLPLFCTAARTRRGRRFAGERGQDLNVIESPDSLASPEVPSTTTSKTWELGVVERIDAEGGRSTYRLSENGEMAEKLLKLEDATLDRLFELNER